MGSSKNVYVGPYLDSKSSDEPFLLNLNEDYISNALESFKKDYSEFIDYLKENGIKFDIKFGVISYYW